MSTCVRCGGPVIAADLCAKCEEEIETNRQERLERIADDYAGTRCTAECGFCGRCS